MKGSQEIALLIKEIAKSKKIAIGDMLVDCELSVNTLSTMQSKGYYPRLEALMKIADYLDVSIDYLLGRNRISSGSGNNYSNIHDIGAGAMIGQNNQRSANVSDNAIEFDKLLHSLNYREQTKLMSLVYDWVDDLKKRTDTASYTYILATKFHCNWSQ